MISVLILTRNEERDLPGCLRSVAWCDDVHVLDSFSTDGTVRVAEEHGARVTQRVFDNWAAHQNWAVANVPFRHRWVLYLDADERVTAEMRAGAEEAAARPGERVAFRVQRRDFLNGTWLRHVQTSPFYIRLFQPARIRYERLVNPVTVVDGEVGQLSGYLDHFPFSKGVGHWMRRHNDYSALEAAQIAANRRAETAAGAPAFRVRSAFLERDFNKRRVHQKELFYRLPGRPLVKFLLLYVGKRGFLDGGAGLQYAALQSIYEYLIVLKTRELEREARGGGREMA